VYFSRNFLVNCESNRCWNFCKSASDTSKISTLPCAWPAARIPEDSPKNLKIVERLSADSRIDCCNQQFFLFSDFSGLSYSTEEEIVQPQLSPEEYCEQIQQLWRSELSYPEDSPERERITVERECAFDNLYHLVYQPIVRFLRVFCKPGSVHAEDPEFLANGVMMRIHVALKQGQFQPCRSFQPWCRQIARSVFVDAWRKHTRSAEVLRAAIDNGARPVASEHVTAGDLQDLLGELPVTERRIVELYYLDQKPLAEIALVLNKSVASVRSVLYRIKSRLFHGEKT
jgi:RNA polymerase sigma factor (sigma-70 family)